VAITEMKIEILDPWLVLTRSFRMWTRGYYWHVDLGFGHVVCTDMKIKVVDTWLILTWRSRFWTGS